MTAKDKAKELVRQFYSIGAIECKQCALIAVDEILNALNSERIIYGSEYCFEENKYFEEVKQEILKL